MVVIVESHEAKIFRVVFQCFQQHKADLLVFQHARVTGRTMLFQPEDLRVTPQTNDEVMPGFHDLPEKSVVRVSAIDDEDGAFCILREIEFFRCRDITNLPIGDLDEIGNLAADVEGSMKLDGSFLSAETCPRKKTETEINRRGINRTQIVLEGEACCCPGTEVAALLQELVEEGFVDLE